MIERYSHNSGLLIFFDVFLFAAASAALGIAGEYIPFAGILIAGWIGYN